MKFSLHLQLPRRLQTGLQDDTGAVGNGTWEVCGTALTMTGDEDIILPKFLIINDFLLSRVIGKYAARSWNEKIRSFTSLYNQSQCRNSPTADGIYGSHVAVISNPQQTQRRSA